MGGGIVAPFSPRPLRSFSAISALNLLTLGQKFRAASLAALDRFLNVLPTVTIREGHRVKVYLAGDLALPDYNNHKMPSDL